MKFPMHGQVFNIQRFSIHDGPGIRTSVFLKGCNLNCHWCHNPESRLPKQEIQYFPQKCQLCLKCIEVCPNGAHYFDATGEKIYDRSRCDLSGECVEHCLHDALVFVSEMMSVAQVVSIVMKDSDYYRNSQGGLTISGGEPLLQRHFVEAIFTETKSLGVHNALDTAANVPWAYFEQVLPVTDLVLLDIKAMRADLHKQGTGVTNTQILENAQKLARYPIDLIVRIPVIPGFNATQKNISATAEFLTQFDRLRYVELLPYHDLGVDKFTSLGRDNSSALFETPSPENLSELKQFFIDQGIEVNVD